MKRLFGLTLSVFTVVGMLLATTGCPDSKTKTTDKKTTTEEKKDSSTTKTTEESKKEEKKKDS